MRIPLNLAKRKPWHTPVLDTIRRRLFEDSKEVRDETLDHLTEALVGTSDEWHYPQILYNPVTQCSTVVCDAQKRKRHGYNGLLTARGHHYSPVTTCLLPFQLIAHILINPREALGGGRTWVRCQTKNCVNTLHLRDGALGRGSAFQDGEEFHWKYRLKKAALDMIEDHQ